MKRLTFILCLLAAVTAFVWSAPFIQAVPYVADRTVDLGAKINESPKVSFLSMAAPDPEGLGGCGPAEIPSDTVLLVHGDASGTSNFEDCSGSSVVGKANTPVGDIEQHVNAKRFGVSGVSLDGNGDYIVFADDADWDFGTGDFTVDMWVKTTDTKDYSVLMSRWKAGPDFWMGLYRGYLAVYNVNYGMHVGSIFLSNDTWTHLAVIRCSGTLYTYVNGTNDLTLAGWVDDINNAVGMGIGADPGNPNFKGKMDEIRISYGMCLWSTNFTPPQEAYGN